MKILAKYKTSYDVSDSGQVEHVIHSRPKDSDASVAMWRLPTEVQSACETERVWGVSPDVVTELPSLFDPRLFHLHDPWSLAVLLLFKKKRTAVLPCTCVFSLPWMFSVVFKNCTFSVSSCVDRLRLQSCTKTEQSLYLQWNQSLPSVCRVLCFTHRSNIYIFNIVYFARKHRYINYCTVRPAVLSSCVIAPTLMWDQDFPQNKTRLEKCNRRLSSY